MIRILVLGSCMFLVGCAMKPPAAVWIKLGSDAAQVARDFKECEYEAEKANPPGNAGPYNESAAFVAGWNEGVRFAKLRTMCMEVRGYQERG